MFHLAAMMLISPSARGGGEKKRERERDTHTYRERERVRETHAYRERERAAEGHKSAVLLLNLP